MDKYKILFSVVLISALTGCFEKETTEVTNTKEWYSANKEELTKKLKECANNPGELKDTPNCINAKAAAHSSMLGKW